MKPRILIIDDNPDMLLFEKAVLIADYEVETAESAEDGLWILKTENIDLIICDVMMPGMDGFSFCKKIKSDTETSHIPVILLTARNTIQSKIEGLEIGADAYIEQPFYKDHLLAQMKSILLNRDRIKEHFISSPVTGLKSTGLSKGDNEFLSKLNDFILSHLEAENIDVDVIATKLNMSRVTLYRKITVLTKCTPSELINVIRLKKAAELLQEGDYKINEVAYKVGYQSASVFTRNFVKQFHMTPSDFLQNHR